MAYGNKTEYRLRMRATVVLHAACRMPHAVRGRSNTRIARETGLPLDTLRCTTRSRPGKRTSSSISTFMKA
ncbi:hypothetical protein [Streptomyces humi]|uniref:hypothetical protein n=1 Tax=Streptomyces humi TaxID=1428620 RepID=UPI0009A0F4EC|nr:hypothetical protein [Streptomyces humi]